MKLKLKLKKRNQYKNYINIDEVTEIALSSLAATATKTSVDLTVIGIILYLATANICGSLSKTIIAKT